MDYHFDSKEDIKLIILSVIRNFNVPVPSTSIVDTVLTHSFAEYFDIQQYLYELTDAQMVTYYIEDDVRYYSLTQKGKDAVEYFSSKIPLTVRERLFKTSRQNAKELSEALSIKADYYPVNEFEYVACLKIVDRGSDLFNLTLSVGTEANAKAVCSRFKKDPQHYYTSIFGMLTNASCEK